MRDVQATGLTSMAFLLQLTDAAGIDVDETAKLEIKVSRKDTTQVTITADASPTLTLPIDATWESAEITIAHPDYVPHLLRLRLDGGTPAWSDPSSEMTEQGGNRTLRIPLGRIRFAPGQIPPFTKPTGDEKGVYVDQREGRPQRYIGIDLNLQKVPNIRILKDLVPYQSSLPTCVLNPHNDDGWLRFNYSDVSDVNPGNGAFAWLEYGSPATRPLQPRFLIAVWAPFPKDALKDGKIDMLAFFSPSTANDLYPQSTYPFRDKYPYSAYGREVIDTQNHEKHDAKVQPYVLLGIKYLFRPTHIVGMCVAAGKPPVIVMPIFPRATESNGAKHMWQPLNSQAGLWRLFIEIAQFLEREGYTGSSFGTNRFNGIIAPTSGDPAPPPPAFSPTNRKRLGIGDIVVSGYSSASPALDSLFRSTAISGSAADYPPKLFGAEPAEFDKRWKEYWALDLTMVEKNTGIPRIRYQNMLRTWLMRDTRRMRLYHSDWTLERLPPDSFYPVLRKQLASDPRLMRDAALASRWSADWREPAAHWSAVFFSGPVLRATYADNVVPSFPLSTPDGGKGDPANAIHGFAMQLGFGHAARLR